MPDLNSGSIALNIFNAIVPMPAGISGLLVTIVDTQRYFVENYTGDTIGATISEKYQSPITDLSTSQVLKFLATQDMGVSSVSVGDLSTSNSNLSEMARMFEEKAMTEIKSLSKGLKVYKARG